MSRLRITSLELDLEVLEFIVDFRFYRKEEGLMRDVWRAIMFTETRTLHTLQSTGIIYFGGVRHKTKNERLLETSSTILKLPVSSMRLVILLSREYVSPCR